MKTIHICEICGKQYGDQNEAIRCEIEHKREEERIKRERAVEEKLLAAISDVVNLYIKKYGKFPGVELSEESIEILANATLEQLVEEIEMFEEDDDDEHDHEDDDLCFFFGDDE